MVQKVTRGEDFVLQMKPKKRVSLILSPSQFPLLTSLIWAFTILSHPDCKSQLLLFLFSSQHQSPCSHSTWKQNQDWNLESPIPGAVISTSTLLLLCEGCQPRLPCPPFLFPFLLCQLSLLLLPSPGYQLKLHYLI